MMREVAGVWSSEINERVVYGWARLAGVKTRRGGFVPVGGGETGGAFLRFLHRAGSEGERACPARKA